MKRTSSRRTPTQERARQTVDAVLEAVPLVVKRHGSHAVTTNRIAEVAGVSVGSLYQYFPDKQAIFAALHERHVDEVRALIEQASAECASAGVEAFSRELLQAHARVAEVHEFLSAAVPESAAGFTAALRHTFEEGFSRADPERWSSEQRERMLFVLPRLVESLVHGVASHGASGPSTSSRERAMNEALRTVEFYVRSSAAGVSLEP